LIRYGSMVDSASGDRALMPGNPGLTDLELAELMTYLRKTYSNDEEIFDVRRSSCDR